ncbi:MAG: riboflavin synthase [Bacteroidota bacterium]
MFTGIIETLGKIKKIDVAGSNVDFVVQSDLSKELHIDQSVSHDGVCLTVTSVGDNEHSITAINETIQKTNLNSWKVGTVVNIERCMKANGRFDGHIVQGHVDTTAAVLQAKEEDGSWLFDFELKKEGLMVEKGSVCINGTSLTCFNVGKTTFSVAIIPYTYEHTNFNQLSKGDEVNIEFDILGKYIDKLLNKK